MDAITRAIKTDQQHDLEFTVELDDQAPDSLRLTEFTWKETLSHPYSDTATLASRDLNLK